MNEQCSFGSYAQTCGEGAASGAFIGAVAGKSPISTAGGAAVGCASNVYIKHAKCKAQGNGDCNLF